MMNSSELGDFGKRVLLIGAGFSKNWGGRLANEVWADVFSSPAVQRQLRLRHALLNERSFEAVMEDVLTGADYDAADRRAMVGAVVRTFERMDELYKKTIISADKAINYATLHNVLRRFQNGAGYLFSLNQDRLLEMLLENRISHQMPHVAPGAPHRIPSQRPNLLSNAYSISLNPVKLHVCHTWINENGVPVMVIGKQKDAQIAGSWLLTEYENLFEAVLSSGDVRLLAVGYSFRDSHINKIIGDAVSQHQCKVFVWDPAHPLDVLDTTAHDAYARTILDGLIGWEPRTIADLMPAVRTIQISDEDVLGGFFQ
jgi:hypothetical protein